MTALRRILKGLPLKKLIASLTLFGFLFISIVPHVLATPRFSSDEPARVEKVKPQQVAPAESIPASEKVRVTLPSGEVEEGRVLICNPFGSGCISDALKAAIQWIFEKLLGFGGDIGKFLLVLIAKMVLYVVHIFAAVLGSDAGSPGNEVCADIPDTEPEQQADCASVISQIQEIDPLFNPEVASFARKFNLFVVADSTFAGLYNSFPDTNPVQYLAYEFQDNILGIRTAQAQGAGTDAIGNTLRSIWVKMRDIAYIAMVLILLVVGFMIMFRKRLDPRTSVTAANSLPRIVMGLILITFSFAISGLFIDFIYISVRIVSGYLTDLTPQGLLDDFAGFVGAGEFVWLPFFTLFSASVIEWGHVLLIFIAVAGVGVLFSHLLLIVVILALIGLIVLDLLIRLVMFVLAVLLFWALLKRFVTMLLLTIFSPFFFLIGSVPGFESVAINWAKRMLASALAFPAILVIVYIAVALLWSDFPIIGIIPGVPSGGGPTAPPPLGGANFFLNLTSLMGLGVLFFASRVPDFIDDMLGLRGPAGKGGFGPGAILAPVGMAGRGFGTLYRAKPVASTAYTITSNLRTQGGPMGLVGRVAHVVTAPIARTVGVPAAQPPPVARERRYRRRAAGWGAGRRPRQVPPRPRGGPGAGGVV